MIESVNRIIGRIGEIQSRIQNIQAIGKRESVQKVEPDQAVTAKNTSADSQKKFSEILSEVLQNNSDNSILGANESSGHLLNIKVGSQQENQALLNQLNKKYSSAEIKTDIQEAIQDAAMTFDLDPNLIKAVIRQESEFNPRAVSSKGAMGLMQLMPKTAESLGVEKPFQARDNIFGGAKYLQMMLSKFSGDVKLALAAYNAGPGAVEQHQGIPPYDETQDYVVKVLDHYKQYKQIPE